MKTNHTVGEWKAELSETFCVIRDKDHHVIARTNPDNIYGTGESISNARLIASCPEIFEALKEVTNQLETIRLEKTERWSNERTNMVSAALLNANRAIKKASGITERLRY